MSTEHLLAYDTPAAQWLEALPVGNGRLGAMVFGGNQAEGHVEHRFQLNDSSAWSGSPHSQDRQPVFGREEADGILSESRRRIGAGDFAGATETLKGLQHRHSQAYLPFADLYLARHRLLLIRQRPLRTGQQAERNGPPLLSGCRRSITAASTLPAPATPTRTAWTATVSGWKHSSVTIRRCW